MSWKHTTARLPRRELLPVGVLLTSVLGGCAASPPASQFPNGQAALDRMQETFACSNGVQAEAKVDHRGEQGRIRGSLLFYAMRPARVRFDIISPFGVTLSTLTSQNNRFELLDFKNKQFLHGKASACNLEKFTRVPVPGHALVSLLKGQAPLLVHDPKQVAMEWSGGRYQLTIPSKHQTTQYVELGVHPADFGKPYGEQRLRVQRVRVVQKGYTHYDAELVRHRSIPMAKHYSDPEGIEGALPVSGPSCSVEAPQAIRVKIAEASQLVVFQYKELTTNPPLQPGLFQQEIPAGVQVLREPDCNAK